MSGLIEAREIASRAIHGVPVIVICDRSWTETARAIDLTRAEKILVISEQHPSVKLLDRSFPAAVEEVEAGQALASQAAWTQFLHSPDVLDQIGRFDPTHRAVVVGPTRLGVTKNDRIFGRRLLYGRDPAWLGLERKLTVDKTLDRLGIPRPKSTAVGSRYDSIDLDSIAGSSGLIVVSNDGEEITNGGQGVRIVDAKSFQSDGTPSRLAEFVEGFPFSISALVLDDAVVALPPIEQIMAMTGPGKEHPKNCGYSCAWQLPRRLHESLVNAVTLVGDDQRAMVGFRGLMTLEGVIRPTLNGFVITEANMRPGDTAGYLSKVTGVPILSFHLLAVAGLLAKKDAVEMAKVVAAQARTVCKVEVSAEVVPLGWAFADADVVSGGGPVAPRLISELRANAQAAAALRPGSDCRVVGLSELGQLASGLNSVSDTPTVSNF